MKIQEKVHIKVMNQSDVKVCVETRNRGYVFEPARNGIPTFEFLNFEDIEYINSKSAVFRTGGLRFEESEESEIFNALMFPRWKEFLVSEQDINDMLFNPTLENQERVIAITDLATIERLRGRLVFYINERVDGISTKNADLINNRYKELRSNKVNSQIVISEIKPDQVHVNNEIELLKKQNDDLQSQIAEMQKMILATMEKQNNDSNDEPEMGEKPIKRGRPKTADKEDKE